MSKNPKILVQVERNFDAEQLGELINDEADTMHEDGEKFVEKLVHKLVIGNDELTARIAKKFAKEIGGEFFTADEFTALKTKLSNAAKKAKKQAAAETPNGDGDSAQDETASS